MRMSHTKCRFIEIGKLTSKPLKTSDPIEGLFCGITPSVLSRDLPQFNQRNCILAVKGAKITVPSLELRHSRMPGLQIVDSLERPLISLHRQQKFPCSYRSADKAGIPRLHIQIDQG